MARIPFWIFNHNVDYFPTLNGLQLYYNPLAEYQVLQTMLLTNSMRYSNFVQYFALIGCCIAVSNSIKLWNKNLPLQTLGFLLFILTLPLAFISSLQLHKMI